jgi:hypothetical protein
MCYQFINFQPLNQHSHCHRPKLLQIFLKKLYLYFCDYILILNYKHYENMDYINSMILHTSLS